MASDPKADSLQAVLDQIPRRYQEEIFAKAQKSNIIAALDTGAGKTLIALLLIKWTVAQEASREKIIVFLVPKVTLVKQQADYINKHTPDSVKIKQLSGAMSLQLTDRKGWRKCFESSHIFVMTPKILHNLITHSLWNINQISLMIFDECHHTRKQDPYNQIMREYFHVPQFERPKIFGMTASAIWDVKNPQASLTLLESNLDSKVIAVRDNIEELRQWAPRPKEVLKYYPFPPESPASPNPTIYRCLQVIDTSVWDDLDIPFSNIDIRYQVTLGNIGFYGASMFLYLEIQHFIESKLAEYKRLQLCRPHDAESMEVDVGPSSIPVRPLPDQIFLIKEILQGFEGYFPPSMTSPIVPIPLTMDMCTPKVNVLVDILLENYTPTFQAIIFVEQRQVASALSRIIQVLPELQGKIRSAFLVGTGVNSEGMTRQTNQAHGDPVKLFKSKEINILIATSVAEEGLDFDGCDLVIRFDPLHHMIAYVQSRGRARNFNSTFVVMCQEDDREFEAKYRALQEKEPEVTYMYQTRHIDIESDDEDGDDDGDGVIDLADRERLVVESTGAKLTYDNSVSLLTYLCSLIPRDAFTPVHKPKYTGDFQSTLELPRALPLSPKDLVYTGPFKRSKKEARRAVAFMAVKRLHDLNVFDDYLLPVANDSSDQDVNEFMVGHGLSAKLRKVPPVMQVDVKDPWRMDEKLWLHPVAIDDEVVAGLVTGTDLPQEKALVGSSTVRVFPGKRLLFDQEFEREQRKMMNDFTKLGIFFSITRSPFTAPLSLYLVPITPAQLPDFAAMLLLLAKPGGSSDWSKISEEYHDNLLVIPRYRLGSIHALRRIRHDLSPLSQPLPGTHEAKAGCSTYHEYWVKKWSRKKGSIDLRNDGPLLEAVTLPHCDMGAYPLNPPTDCAPPAHDVKEHSRMLPQNGTLWLAFSFQMRRAYEVLPALCQRITNVYRARCARHELKLPFVPTNLLIEVFTIPSTQLGFNNQRLETLGDAVLQVCMTVQLLNAFPSRHEGQLTKMRQKVVSNRFLMQRALDVGLEQYVNSELASVHKWRYVLGGNNKKGGGEDDGQQGKQEEEEEERARRTVSREFPRRSLQDCMEAILAASFLTGGIEHALHMGTALGLEFGGPLPWNMRYRIDAPPSPISPLFESLEANLGYKFKHGHLLLEALTHPSFAVPSEGPSYQRLEFLGDAILDLVVIKYLYDKLPNATSHQLAFPRTRAICAQTLANLAVRRLGLHKMLLINSVEHTHAIDRYVPVLERTSGADVVRTGWRHDPPKALSDVFESVVGAVLVDSGYDYERTAAVVEYVMEEVLEVLVEMDLAKDPVSLLMEWKQAEGKVVKEAGQWDAEQEGIAVLLHDHLLVAPVVWSSLAVSKFVAAERALAVLQDADSDHSLAKLCTCSSPMAVDGQEGKEGTPSTDCHDAQEVVDLLTGIGIDDHIRGEDQDRENKAEVEVNSKNTEEVKVLHVGHGSGMLTDQNLNGYHPYDSLVPMRFATNGIAPPHILCLPEQPQRPLPRNPVVCLREAIMYASLFLQNSARPSSMKREDFKNPWYIAAAVAFSASNKPEGVPRVFEHALADLRSTPTIRGTKGGVKVRRPGNEDEDEKKILARKMREALFKSGLICGYPRAINGLRALHAVMPEELRDRKLLRNPNVTFGEYEQAGERFFETLYGETAEDVQGLLDAVYPDMGWFSRTIGYGLVYGPALSSSSSSRSSTQKRIQTHILTSLETSYTLVAALITIDTPQQIAWHLAGARRAGASVEELSAVREVSERVVVAVKKGGELSSRAKTA
ncbi:unnamed protein product [Cyclocybe aegerita]|uniref:Dicer-like protein 1 n=1 Tax=Cyclocybe aegerita TaxID=1973307 RepID=A0A8S0WCV6_CYCAE|nr:unnamed protein product [Cyclocybe aegerita]